MNLQEQKIFEVVSVVDELPKDDTWKFAVMDSHVFGGKKEEMTATYYRNGWGGKNLNVTHWLREKQAITLTKKELIGLIDDAMSAGKNWAETYQGWFMPTQDQHKEKFDEFLKSKGLTK